ncbi:LysR family transcriptional regulator [Mycobacterium yunnanensis]|uniref:Probable hydrogen peroxide-inducible genes activator n=1 Tax=Mycobacterium yunnanensis TaxID=368477 RepID=A0A9X2YWQ2_9MYCO|nr:LysR family transcriptional regulator [Mycobacterium yunnanensis]MCV7419928.1 LysR family transcriptional regulator [Mycobacterium yunnanensis]
MDVRELQYFVAVAEARNFTKGASRVDVVQSTVSAAVSRLEREVGQPLFVRGGRTAELTEAGRVLLRHARTVTAQLRVAHEELANLQGDVTGTVTLGTVLSTGDLDLTATLVTFRQRYPNVEVRVRLTPGNDGQHAEAIAEGLVDLALLPHDGERPGVKSTPVGHVQLGLATTVDDPLAAAENVGYDAVSTRAFVDFPTDWGNRRVVDAMFRSAGVQRRISVEVNDVDTAVRFTAAGIGLCFLPTTVIGAAPRLALVDLAQPPPRHVLGVMVAADRPASPATQALHRALVNGRHRH